MPQKSNNQYAFRQRTDISDATNTDFHRFWLTSWLTFWHQPGRPAARSAGTINTTMPPRRSEVHAIRFESGLQTGPEL